MKSLVGELVGQRYEILEALGNGASSVVYKAKETTTGQIVALKFLHMYLVQKEDTFKRFELEARTATLLDHPNIVKVRAYVPVPDGQPYLVSDYVEGETLASILLSEKELALPRAWKLFIQLAEALEHAHEKGVVHRNLKPGNIIISNAGKADEKAHIADFGVAKLLPSSGQEIQDLTQKGAVIGSPLYMSPEQCLGRTIDGRADIYSFGCLMYTVLTGKPPLKGDHIIDTMSKHVREIAAPFDQVRPDLSLPKYAQGIVFQCMAKRPEDRYQNATLLKKDLVRLQQGKIPRAGTSIPKADQLAGGKQKQNNYPRIALALFALLLIFTFGFMALMKKKPISNKALTESTAALPHKKVSGLSPLALLRQADQLRLQRRDAESELIYRQAIMRASELAEKDSESNEILSVAHYGLAELYRRLARWPEAEKEFQLALYAHSLTSSTDPVAKGRIEIELAACYMQQGRLKQGRELLESVVANNSDPLIKAKAYWMLADIDLVEQNVSKAEHFLDLAMAEMQKNPGKREIPEYLVVIARNCDFLLGYGKVERCRKVLMKAWQDDITAFQKGDSKETDVALFAAAELSRIDCASKNYEQAIATLEATVPYVDYAAKSRRIALLDCLAASYFLSGQVAKASAVLDRDDPAARGRLGHAATIIRLLIANKQYDQAHMLIREIKSTFKSPFEKAELHLLLSNLDLAEGKTEPALIQIDKALELLKDGPTENLRQACFFAKCKILRASGKTDAAQVIEKTVGVVPPFLEPFENLVPLYQRRAQLW